MNKLIKNTLLMSISFAIIGATITLIDANVAQTMKAGLDSISPNIAETLGLTEGLVAELGKNSAAWTGAFFAMFGGASVLVPKAVGKILGLSEKEQVKGPEIKIEQGKGVSLKLQQSQEQEAAAETGFPLSEPEEEKQQSFSAKIVAERSENGVSSAKI